MRTISNPHKGKPEKMPNLFDPVSLFDSYWRLEDTQDAVGSNHLENVGGVTFGAAKLGNGAMLSGFQRLRVSASGGLNPVGSFTVSGLVKLSNTSANSISFSCLNWEEGELAYRVEFVPGGGKRFIILAEVEPDTYQQAEASYDLNDDEWVQVVAGFDATQGRLFIRVNNESLGETQLTGQAVRKISGGMFAIGYDSDEDEFDARMIDEVGFVASLLTQQQRNKLYNHYFH